MVDYGLPDGYHSRTAPAYYDAVDADRNWQHAVYAHAFETAKREGYHTIIDIGCGDGRKLQLFLTTYRVIGLDYGANLAYCRQQYPDGSWLECQLEDTHSYPVLDALLLKNALLICADVIEHLINPDTLLAHLSTWLADAPCAIVSTPERDKVHGAGHLGLPVNPCHVREWNTAEFVAYLAAHQLHATSIHHVPAYEGCKQTDNLLVTITRNV